MVCQFYIDAANYPNARDRMQSRMTQMCPGMGFTWTVTCDPVPDPVPPGSPPWRFTFNVHFEVNSEYRPTG